MGTTIRILMNGEALNRLPGAAPVKPPAYPFPVDRARAQRGTEFGGDDK